MCFHDFFNTFTKDSAIILSKEGEIMNKANQIYKKYVENEVSIIENHEYQLLNKDKIEIKVLAFLSELGKLSEESECFNFWERNILIKKENVLEAYLDALHLLLSIGYELHVDSIKNYNELAITKSITDLFFKVYEDVLKIRTTFQFEDYQNCIDDYFSLGFHLGLDFDEILENYLKR